MSCLQLVSPWVGAQRATEWGFPRPIGMDEVVGGVWRGYKDFMVTWIGPTLTGNVWSVHVAVDPKHHKQYWPWKRCMKEWCALAGEQVGGPGVLAVSPTSRAILPYLGRLGFFIDPDTGFWVIPFKGPN